MSIDILHLLFDIEKVNDWTSTLYSSEYTHNMTKPDWIQNIVKNLFGFHALIWEGFRDAKCDSWAGQMSCSLFKIWLFWSKRLVGITLACYCSWHNDCCWQSCWSNWISPWNVYIPPPTISWQSNRKVQSPAREWMNQPPPPHQAFSEIAYLRKWWSFGDRVLSYSELMDDQLYNQYVRKLAT